MTSRGSSSLPDSRYDFFATRLPRDDTPYSTGSSSSSSGCGSSASIDALLSWYSEPEAIGLLGCRREAPRVMGAIGLKGGNLMRKPVDGEDVGWGKDSGGGWKERAGSMGLS